MIILWPDIWALSRASAQAEQFMHTLVVAPDAEKSAAAKKSAAAAAASNPVALAASAATLTSTSAAFTRRRVDELIAERALVERTRIVDADAVHWAASHTMAERQRAEEEERQREKRKAEFRAAKRVERIAEQHILRYGCGQRKRREPINTYQEWPIIHYHGESRMRRRNQVLS